MNAQTEGTAQGEAGENPLADLVRRAQQGDATALPALRQALADDPGCWERHGDFAAQAQAAWLDLVAGSDLLLREALAQKAAALRAELSGPDPAPLERLLVERVLACWLQAHHADAIFAQNAQRPAAPAALRELMRRQESSQRRYLAAIKQLAVVRKLLKPLPSAFDLAMRPVAESNPAARGRAARPTPTGGSRPGTVLDGQPALN